MLGAVKIDIGSLIPAPAAVLIAMFSFLTYLVRAHFRHKGKELDAAVALALADRGGVMPMDPTSVVSSLASGRETTSWRPVIAAPSSQRSIETAPSDAT